MSLTDIGKLSKVPLGCYHGCRVIFIFCLKINKILIVKYSNREGYVKL